MLNSLTINKIWLLLVLSWFIGGLTGTLAGFTGLFYSSLSFVLILPITALLLGLKLIINKFPSFLIQEKVIFTCIILWWALHSLQVFVPETGFDALWYHLPLAHQTTQAHGFIGSSDFYQSFNPQFSDVIFYLGFAVAGEIGTKIIAYLFGISLMFTTYMLSRFILNRSFSLLLVLIASSFQVVSWQSSSFYIDLAKSFWELSALVFIIQEKKQAALAGLSFGASLASKLFSLLLLPIQLGITWLLKGKTYTLVFVVLCLAVAVPYYIFAQQVSGNAFYSAIHHTEKIDEIGGASSAEEYVVHRTLLLPKALVEMVITREYSSPLIILFLPLVFFFRKYIWRNKILLALTLFSGYQLLLWWYIPPSSTRYALAGFITALIVVVFLLSKLVKTKESKKLLFTGLLAAGLLAFPIRLTVAYRSWLYISGQQTKEEYLQQFLDGNVDTVLKNWHNLP